MSRRSRKKQSNPIGIILTAVVVVAIGVVGYRSLPSGDTPEAKTFPLGSYIQNCNSLRGSTYAISGEILENYHHDPKVGKFILLTVEHDEDLTADQPNAVGLLVPSSLDGPNLETKQKYEFVVTVEKEGALVAQSYSSK